MNDDLYRKIMSDPTLYLCIKYLCDGDANKFKKTIEEIDNWSGIK